MHVHAHLSKCLTLLGSLSYINIDSSASRFGSTEGCATPCSLGASKMEGMEKKPQLLGSRVRSQHQMRKQLAK